MRGIVLGAGPATAHLLRKLLEAGWQPQPQPLLQPLQPLLQPLQPLLPAPAPAQQQEAVQEVASSGGGLPEKREREGQQAAKVVGEGGDR